MDRRQSRALHTCKVQFGQCAHSVSDLLVRHRQKRLVVDTAIPSAPARWKAIVGVAVEMDVATMEALPFP
jgi:hypothetical protein